MSNDTSWRQDWSIDPDPLASANAMHLPTGVGYHVISRPYWRRDRAGRIEVTVLFSDWHRDALDRAHRAHLAMPDDGSPPGAWDEHLQDQARTLWRELGLDENPKASLAEPLPCVVKSWRADWTVNGRATYAALPVLVHVSGLTVTHAYGAISDEVPVGWTATPSSAWTPRQEREAHILWMELGYFDTSPDPFQPPPLGERWRELWKVVEEPGEQWMEHVSGLRLMPNYTVVDEDGLTAWSIHVDPRCSELGRRMCAKVGSEVWNELIEDQGFRKAAELGYTAKHLEVPPVGYKRPTLDELLKNCTGPMNPPGRRALRVEWLAYEISQGIKPSKEDCALYAPLRAEVVAKVGRAEAVRAMAAFNRVLYQKGYHAEEACTAQFDLDRWDDGGFEEGEALEELDQDAAAAWRDACEAARVELCDKAPHLSASAFEVIEFFDPVPRATMPWAFSLSLAASDGGA